MRAGVGCPQRYTAPNLKTIQYYFIQLRPPPTSPAEAHPTVQVSDTTGDE